MAITTTKLNGTTGSKYYYYYTNVIIDDTVRSDNTFAVQLDSYVVNNDGRFSTSGWTIYSGITDVGDETLTSQSINTTGVNRYGGETLVHSKKFYVPITMATIQVITYISKNSYASYEPGYCSVNASVSMPRVQSNWNSSLLSLPNIASNFQLPITKYNSSYYDVVEVRNSNNTTLVKTINNAKSGTNYSFTSTELNTIYTMDSNVSAYPLIFYMDLLTYTSSSKTTQVGTTQRLKCEAYLVNGEPTATYTIVEQDSKVSTFLGSTTSSKIIQNASDLLFTIVVSPKNSATVKSVKVNGSNATLSSGTTYTKKINNITTGTFNVVITDSRNLSTTYTATKTVISYVACKINSWEVKRETPVSSNVLLTADISCNSASTLDSKTNAKVLRYSKNGSSWTTIPSSAYTLSNNKITITNYAISNYVAYTTTSKFYLQVYDQISTATDNITISKGIPTYMYSETNFVVNGNFKMRNEDGTNEIDEHNVLKIQTSERLIGYGTIDENRYRKLVSFGTMPNATSKTKAHGISNLSMIYDARAIAMITSQNKWVLLPNADAKVEFDDTNIIITTTTNMSSYNRTWVIIEYTKSS